MRTSAHRVASSLQRLESRLEVPTLRMLPDEPLDLATRDPIGAPDACRQIEGLPCCLFTGCFLGRLAVLLGDPEALLLLTPSRFRGLIP
ncbi:uncharacterized protein CMC5_060380 [Chondromyces crocatus]|uniref:Uncharacterized protein n=1 Tax=Chondromyces crocatus TaxID=52 RepID=A0A0K1EMG1_CHOCO|nr:uncharacterized protein CMC5_060380 [Chondromyces crocatus]